MPIEKKLIAWKALENINEKDIANQLFKKISKEIKFIERKDWTNHQICGDFPNVDLRCLVFCCPPSKDCPFRNSVLKKLNKSVKDYKIFKEKLAKEILIWIK
jgi:predicted metal-binding transcription factor (methanogenesis marker protein 9)